VNDSSNQPSRRRPLRSRETRWARVIAGRLAQRGVSPNAISVAGVLAALAAGAALAATSHVDGIPFRVYWAGAALLIQGRLLCNLFDGMVAIQRGVASPLGELFNEVPDRIADAAVLIGLGYAAGGIPEFGYTAALVAVFVAYVRAAVTAAGAPNDFCGPLAKPQRMALATALCLYMAVAPADWRWPWGEVNVVLIIMIGGGLVTAARRLRRAACHLRNRAA